MSNMTPEQLHQLLQQQIATNRQQAGVRSNQPVTIPGTIWGDNSAPASPSSSSDHIQQNPFQPAQPQPQIEEAPVNQEFEPQVELVPTPEDLKACLIYCINAKGQTVLTVEAIFLQQLLRENFELKQQLSDLTTKIDWIGQALTEKLFSPATQDPPTEQQQVHGSLSFMTADEEETDGEEEDNTKVQQKKKTTKKRTRKKRTKSK